ncbi:CYTH domain-containing protein [Staphylococcus sp. 17KM0847]|uniref:CYTH domain-containing protein n=1 Tax=Staphylococcus sp. 17KM0847 TaxID=2583989 RepID=UPI0015DBD458|nr:CYTH domain-containing protein [Staphylococcus sp. 17KM0847]QLK85647.1 CYTH domain-containing protein [Staphylococcus sp. 17KM0847]
MAVEHEIEFKQILEPSTYEAIKATYFSSSQSFSQINHYIDTPDLQIIKHKMALRIREKANGTNELTLKVPAHVGLTEYNHLTSFQPISDHHVPETYITPDIKKILQQYHIDVSSLKVLGTLTTHRMETQLRMGLLVLDHSQYLGKEDYELEFEVSSYKEGLCAFEQILSQFQLKHQQPANKVQRFFEQQQNLFNNHTSS